MNNNCNPPFSCFSCELPDCTKETSVLKMSKAEKKFMAIAELPDGRKGRRIRKRAKQ